jgi:hypothetical protein
MNIAKTTHPIQFNLLSGQQFERLVFAYLWRRWSWKKLEWYGQVGKDQGSDIRGVRENDWGRDEIVIVACANWKKLTSRKVIQDIDKIVKAEPEPPALLIVVAGGTVAPKLRKEIENHARSVKIFNTQVWSGSELEEQARFHAESVVRRFMEGEEFPPEASEIIKFVDGIQIEEGEALRLLGQVFDRPAFYTRFGCESSLPAFHRAISDTIEAINTGICRTREGVIFRRMPSKNDFKDTAVRTTLDSIVRGLNQLRIVFDEHLKMGTLKPCGCTNADCSTFMVTPMAERDLDSARTKVLDEVRRIVPDFHVRLS